MAKKILTTNHSTNFKQALNRYVAKNVKNLYYIEDLASIVDSDNSVTIIGTSCPTTNYYGTNATGYIIKTKINNKRVLTEGDVGNTGNICYARPDYRAHYYNLTGQGYPLNDLNTSSYVIRAFIGDGNSPYGNNDYGDNELLMYCDPANNGYTYSILRLESALYYPPIAYVRFSEGKKHSSNTNSWSTGPITGDYLCSVSNAPTTNSYMDYILAGVEPWIYGVVYCSSYKSTYKIFWQYTDNTSYIGNLRYYGSTPMTSDYGKCPVTDNTLIHTFTFAVKVSTIASGGKPLVLGGLIDIA